MTLLADKAERSRIASIVQEALDRRQPEGYRIEADAETVLEDDGWFRIVAKTPNDVRTYDFYNALAEAEGELQDDRGLSIVIVPVHGD